MTDVLHERARRIRERALVRSWEYRQRNQAKGVWNRLRRVLVDASQVWEIDDNDSDLLERQGCLALGVGRELLPPKRLYFVSEGQLAGLASRRPLAVRLSAPLLQARILVLVAHR